MAAALLWSVIAGCGEPSDTPTELDARAVDQLRAFGYLDYAEAKGDSREGVTLVDANRWHPGYTLYTIRRLCTAHLIDLAGHPVRSWSHPCRAWGRADLLPNGDLLAIGWEQIQDEALKTISKSRYVIRFSWDGHVIWKRRLPAHHDIEVMPNGHLLTLLQRLRHVPKLSPSRPVKDAGIAILSEDGRILEEASLYEILSAAEGLPLRVPTVDRRTIDLFHANSVEWMRDLTRAHEHPLYGTNNVIICLRNQDSVVIIDWTTKKLVWAWGQGQLSGPHDATMLDNGHLLIFDNGIH